MGKMLIKIRGRLNLKLPKRHFTPKGMLGSLRYSIKMIGKIYIAKISITAEAIPTSRLMPK